jgi:hypothetical protein
MTKFFDTAEEALAAAPAIVDRVYADFSNRRVQNDEAGSPVDFFSPMVFHRAIDSHACNSKGAVFIGFFRQKCLKILMNIAFFIFNP